MRDRNQVVLPLNSEICIPKGDFVFKVAEICEELDYSELFNTYMRSWRKTNPITRSVKRRPTRQILTRLRTWHIMRQRISIPAPMAEN